MVAGLVHGHAAGVDGFDRAHTVALDTGDLDEAADGVAGHSEIVRHGDLGGVFDLGVGAVERGDHSSGGHRTGYADLTLAAYFGAGDAGVLFIEDADGGGGEEVTDQSLFLFVRGAFDKAHVVVGDRRDDTGGTVRGCSHDSAASCVLFVDCHRVDGAPVHGGQRIFGALGLEAACKTRGAATHVE